VEADKENGRRSGVHEAGENSRLQPTKKGEIRTQTKLRKQEKSGPSITKGWSFGALVKGKMERDTPRTTRVEDFNAPGD